MGTIAEKLSYLIDTKDLFKDRLNSLGAEITSSTTFRNYLTWLDTFYGEVSDKTDISQNGVVGRTSQESTRGINVYNVNSHYVLSDGYSINDEDWITNTYDNSQGIEHYENIWCRATNLLETSTNYLIVCEIKSVSGSGILYPYTKHSSSAIDTQHSSYSFSNLSAGQKILIPVTTKSSFSGLSCDLRTLVRYNEGNSGSITFRLSLLTDTSITSDTFVYEPFTNGASPNPDFPQPINNLSGDVSYKVSGKNLCPTNISNWESGQYNVSGTKQDMASRIRLKELLPIKPNTTYYFDTIDTTEFSLIHNFIIRECDKNGSVINSIGIVNNQSTYTSNNNAYYLMVTIGTSSTTSGETFENYQTYFNEGKIKPFICLDSEIDKSYEPYIEPQTFTIPLGDIELCKIDTYEDKIYSSNGRFYLVKNINSTIINGTEPNFTADNKPSGLTYYSYNLYNDNFVMPSSVCYCDKLLYSENSLYSNDIQGIKPTSTGRIKIKVFDSSLSTVDLFKTWLSNNNLLMYYIMNTATTTEITQENYPSLYNALKQIQDYLTAYKINKEFILGYSSPEIEY